MDKDSALQASISDSQIVAHKLGEASFSVQVLGWARKHVVEIPTPAFKELMDLVGRAGK